LLGICSKINKFKTHVVKKRTLVGINIINTHTPLDGGWTMVKTWLKQTPSFISLYTQPYTASSLVTHPLFPGDFPGDPAPSHVLPPPTLPVDQSPLLKIWSKWCSRWTIQPSRNGWKITGDSRTDWRTGGSSCTIQLRLSSLDAMERKWDVEFFFQFSLQLKQHDCHWFVLLI
jgi:hypothetical protein